MNIGIITFHWATNYGAILQAWCLQDFLIKQGHEVEIINYKPVQYDFSWKNIVLHPGAWRNIKSILLKKKKERLLSQFRNNHLRLTRRYTNVFDMVKDTRQYNVMISGSDQVLNPNFTICGEDNKPSAAYYLSYVHSNIIKIGYAVSFGCYKYPPYAIDVASRWINSFNAIGVRERTGVNILKQLKYKGDYQLVPDPTILYGTDLFEEIGISVPSKKKNYICVYMLRNKSVFDGNVRYIDERHQQVTVEQWLQTIVSAIGLITDSYHGMIIAILSHVPFAVYTNNGRNRGMNDRLVTLLKILNLENRIVSDTTEAMSILNKPINFEYVDSILTKYKKIGENFLFNYINQERATKK